MVAPSCAPGADTVILFEPELTIVYPVLYVAVQSVTGEPAIPGSTGRAAIYVGTRDEQISTLTEDAIFVSLEMVLTVVSIPAGNAPLLSAAT